LNIIKRNGKEVAFDISRIINAITKANNEVEERNRFSTSTIIEIANKITKELSSYNRAVAVEEVQDLVEKNLVLVDGGFDIAKRYMLYRYEKAILRKQNTTDAKILSVVNLENEEVKQENSNKDPVIIPTQRDYIAGETSRDITERYLLPAEIVKAHKAGIIHFHDSDYFIQHSHNCDLINLEDMLQNGTVINKTKIEKPHSFATACNVATQIMAQVASSQYGGQTITLSHLAPFVDISRQRIKKEVEQELVSVFCAGGIKVEKDFDIDKNIDRITERRLKDEIKRGVQTMQYQINTLMTTNGQTPFVSVFMYLSEVTDAQTKADLALIIEEVLKQRIEGVKNEKGVWITPAFPKLLYVLEEDNIHKDSKYFYLTKLAAKCTAKRMVPDYISEKIMKEVKIDANGNGNVFPCMGCRSFLTPYIDENGNPKYYGRFNQGVVTINLVDAACSSEKSMDKFWEILNERLELCHKALRIRHERLRGTPSDVAPILWQNGALARLSKGETIDKLLYGDYSTLSLGYAGLWECVYYLIGKKLSEPEGEELGLKIMQALNNATNKWKAAENIGYSVYGTPLESTTYKFAKCLQERFGIIEGVTDKNYITNSYHIKVTEPVDAFTKLATESKFQKLSPGGAISYVEVPNMQDNIEAVLAVVEFIYNNIMYAELNTKSDVCNVCGYNGEIKIVEDENGKLVWECPQCHNRDQSKMNVTRRTCGYLGSNFWNQGRTQEIKERVLHL
jgi:ribonucleoside-triphosphate reductase